MRFYVVASLAPFWASLRGIFVLLLRFIKGAGPRVNVLKQRYHMKPNLKIANKKVEKSRRERKRQQKISGKNQLGELVFDFFHMIFYRSSTSFLQYEFCQPLALELDLEHLN